MLSPQRQVSKRVTRLSTRASTYHGAVTLYEATSAGQSSTSRSPSPKLSKRIKLEADSKPSGFSDSEPPSKSLRRTSQTVKLECTEPTEDTSSRVMSKSSKKQKPIPQSLDTPHPAPPRWEETYDAIKTMRAQIVAPVDTMGCDQAQHKEKDPKVETF